MLVKLTSAFAFATKTRKKLTFLEENIMIKNLQEQVRCLQSQTTVSMCKCCFAYPRYALYLFLAS
jgi:hypothetical protein